MPSKYKIEGDLREALYSDCNAWADAVAAGGGRFLGGAATPGLADLAVYGVLRAVWHTPTFEDVMAHSRISGWYKDVEAAIGASARVDASVKVAAAVAAAA
jgi:hypothetical protein